MEKSPIRPLENRGKLYTRMVSLLVVGLFPTLGLSAINRVLDPVVIPGTKLALALQTRIDDLSLWALRDGKLQPIPFQVDEKKGEDYLSTPEGILTNDDELVFMVKDAGEALKDKALLPAGASKVWELEVKDPRDNGTAHVYLLSGKVAFTKPAGYMKYSKEADAEVVESPDFKVRLVTGTAIVKAVLKKDGTGWKEIFNGIRGEGRLTLKLLGTTITRTQEDTLQELKQVLTGPVRVARVVSIKFKIGLGISTPSSKAINYYYPNFTQSPNNIDVPFKMSVISSKADADLVLLFPRLWEGGKFFTKSFPNGVTIPKAPAKPTYSDLNHLWGMLENGDTRFMYLGRLDTLSQIRPMLVFQTSPQGPQVVVRVDLITIERGLYKLRLLSILPPPGRDYREAFWIDEKPLLVTARPF